ALEAGLVVAARGPELLALPEHGLALPLVDEVVDVLAVESRLLGEVALGVRERRDREAEEEDEDPRSLLHVITRGRVPHRAWPASPRRAAGGRGGGRPTRSCRRRSPS